MTTECIGNVIYPKELKDGNYIISFGGAGLKLRVTVKDGKVMYSNSATGPINDIIQPGIEITPREEQL